MCPILDHAAGPTNSFVADWLSSAECLRGMPIELPERRPGREVDLE